MLRKHASQTELVWVGRGMVLLIALIAIGIASNPESKVLGLVLCLPASVQRSVRWC